MSVERDVRLPSLDLSQEEQTICFGCVRRIERKHSYQVLTVNQQVYLPSYTDVPEEPNDELYTDEWEELGKDNLDELLGRIALTGLGRPSVTGSVKALFQMGVTIHFQSPKKTDRLVIELSGRPSFLWSKAFRDACSDGKLQLQSPLRTDFPYENPHYLKLLENEGISTPYEKGGIRFWRRLRNVPAEYR